MLASIFFLLYVHLATAEYGWKAGTQYSYSVRGRTVTGLNQVTNQFTGVLMRAMLNIQAKSDSNLSLQIKGAEFTEIHANLSNGWDTEISDESLHYVKLPLQDEPFELYIHDGIIKEMIVDKSVSIWEINILKGILSLLQIDIQSENIKRWGVNIISSNKTSGFYKTMEDSVNGIYETIYDVSELKEYLLQSKPELLPLPHLRGNGKVFQIVKNRNFSNGYQHIVQHFGFNHQTNWNPGSNQMGNFLSRTSISHIIISGNLKHYTVQSSVTDEKIIIAPHLYNKQKGIVGSRLNITIESVSSIKQPIPVVSNPQPIRNLVYEYYPFDERKEVLRENQNEKQSDYDDDARWSSKKPAHHNFSEYSGSLLSSERESMVTHEPYHLHVIKLSEPINTDFIPFYVNGKTRVFHDTKVITYENVIRLARETSLGIITPNTLTGEHTLSKFNALVQILRTMSAKQLKDVFDQLYYPYSKAKWTTSIDNAMNYQTWLSFRDAVGQAGTGPALVTIRNWVVSQKIKGEEASQLISSLSNSAKHPTIEYLEYFFEKILNDKIVKKQPTLRANAVLSFTDLVRKAIVEKRTGHNHNPVHIFGTLTKKSDASVTGKFIPYFQKQLQKAVEENNSINILLNIHALNNIAHPHILLVLKTYLEGKIPISNFQRLVIVTSMDKIAKIYPDLTRTILYRIYQNMADTPEIRVAAVMQIMKTNPPVQMLQSMAQRTNFDQTRQVNAAVKSAIESIAKQEKNEYNWNMVEKARTAANLLTPETFGVQYSRNFLNSYIVKQQNLAYKHHLALIHRGDSIFPSSLFYNIKNNIGGYKYNRHEVQFMTSSMNKLSSLLGECFGHRKRYLRDNKKNTSNSKWSLNNIYNIFNFKKEEEHIEGYLLATLFGGKQYFAFDNYTLENVPKLISGVSANLMKNSRFNYTKIYNHYSMEIAFPMIMGFPFIYTLETPTLVNMGLQMTGSLQPLQYDSDLAKSDILNITGNYHFVYSMHKVGKMGFITPHNDKMYFAGLEQNVHMHFPLKAKVDLNLKANKVDAFFEPSQKNNEQKLFEYSTVAFTTIKEVYDTNPISVNKNTQIIKEEPVNLVQHTIGKEKIGLSFDLKYATYRSNIFKKYKDHDLVSLFSYADMLDEINNQNFTITFNPQSSWSQLINLSLAYNKTVNINSKAASERMNFNEYKKGGNKEDFVIPSFENKESYQQELNKNVAIGIKDPHIHFINMQLAFEGVFKTEYELYFAYADSYVSNVSRILAVVRNSTTASLSPKEYSAALQMTSTSSVSPGGYENILHSTPNSKIRGRVDFGEQIPYNNHILVQGELNTSQERLHYLKRHPLGILCEKQTHEGYHIQSACRNITRRRHYYDDYYFSIDYQDIPNEFKKMAQKFYRYINTLWYDYNMDTELKRIKGNMDIHAKFGNSLLSSNISIVASDFSDRFENVPVHEWVRPLIVIHPQYNMIERLGHKIMLAQEFPICTLDKDVITTFDNYSYYVNMGNTAHILAQNIPGDYKFQTNDNNVDDFSIIAHQHPSKLLGLTVVIGDDVLEIIPIGVDLPVSFIYNGQQIAVSDSMTKLLDIHENVVFELFAVSEDAVKLIAEKNGFEIIYHGSHTSIGVSNRFRSNLRGLCGNFDGELYNEFTTPENCIMSDGKQFIASYGLEESSKKSIVRSEQGTSNSLCFQQTYLLGNAVNEEEVKQYYGRKKKINNKEKIKRDF